MARPERNSVDYFPFICEDGNKMYVIEEKYGNDGFATFVKILRELAKAEYHYLNLSKGFRVMYLSAKCKVKEDILIKIIDDLVELEKFDRELWEKNKVIWCQDFVDSIQDAYSKRKNDCITYEGLLSLLPSLGTPKPSKQKTIAPVKPQSIVEDRKTDNKKEENNNNTSIIEKFNFRKELLKYGFDKKIVDDWLKVRKDKKASNTETAFSAFIKKVEASKYSKEEIIKTCAEESWKGFNESWIDNLKGKTNGQQATKSGASSFITE